jgi:hypothetical protein
MALLAPRNVLLQANAPIQVPLGIMPYVAWNVNSPCAQPAGASLTPGDVGTPLIFLNATLTIEVICTPLGGNPVQLGPFTYNFDTPTMPGLQSPNSIDFDIPGGTFDGTVPVVCEVSGTYTVEFTDGTGSGTLSASNSVTVYIVPASPDDPTKPRLDMQYFPTGGGDAGFQICRRGDQAYFYFLVSNNDLRNSVELQVTTTLDPRGNYPDGFDLAEMSQNYQSLVYSIQDPRGDFYRHDFVQNPATWLTLPPGDPLQNPASLTKTISLRAGQSRFVAVCVGSFGKCGNGSCNKLTVRITGTFLDGGQALGCASSALLVGEVPGKSARCEIRDEIKAGPSSGAFWTPTQFFDNDLQIIPLAHTHAAGDANPMGQRQTSTFSGESRSDYVRFEPSGVPRGVIYGVGASTPSGSSSSLVTVDGLPAVVGESKAIPVIFGVASALRIAIDCRNDSIRIYVNNSSNILLHAGKFSEFLESPPQGFGYDATTCRIFTKTASDDVPEICADRYYFNKLIPQGDIPGSKTVQVYNQTSGPLQGNVEILGNAANYLNLQSTSFSGQINYTIAQNLPLSPGRASGLFRINVPGTLGDLYLPVVLAQLGRLPLTFSNEPDLLNAFRIMNARGGSVTLSYDQPIPTNLGLSITNLSINQDGPSGDFLTVEGDIQSPSMSPAGKKGVEADAEAALIIDGSECPAPCSLFTFTGDHNVIRGIRFENFPGFGVAMVGDSNQVIASAFAGNGAGGVRINGSGNMIGGGPLNGNRFEDNTGPGVVIESGTGNAILFNTFAGNTGSAIDLGGDGLTANDPDDADAGPNGLQNFPELENVQVSDNNLTIEGTLRSTPNSLFTLQFFANDTCSATGGREAMVFLASGEVATDANGEGSFSIATGDTSAASRFITATATDANGNTSEFSACFGFVTGVANGETLLKLPDAFALYQNYPNPFNPSTTIRFDLPKASFVRVRLYDLLGRQIVTLMEEKLAAGNHKLEFDGSFLSSGIYFYYLEADGFVQAMKMTLIE